MLIKVMCDDVKLSALTLQFKIPLSAIINWFLGKNFQVTPFLAVYTLFEYLNDKNSNRVEQFFIEAKQNFLVEFCLLLLLFIYRIFYIKKKNSCFIKFDINT